MARTGKPRGRPKLPDEERKASRILFRVEEERFWAYAEAADRRHGGNMSAWMREHLDKAAGYVEG